MASKKKKNTSPADSRNKVRVDETPPKKTQKNQSTRELVEQVLIAFILAFMIRTFQAEAFVIPTGSMSPTLMGRHKDVNCPECGQRFKVNASDEKSTIPEKVTRLRNLGFDVRGMPIAQLNQLFDTVAGVCTSCRYTMPVRDDVPEDVVGVDGGVEGHSSFTGDRLIVNKYAYSFISPKRWDVVVFKYPGNAQTNYIKRLVGLPGETLKIYQGDLFVKSEENEAYVLAPRSPEKMMAMRQLVHDTNHDASRLYRGGWPLRWTSESEAWKSDVDAQSNRLTQAFVGNAESGETAWLRYRHTVPSFGDWQSLGDDAASEDEPQPELITDFNSYNTEFARHDLSIQFGRTKNPLLKVPKSKYGLHWTGDLMLDADVAVKQAKGTLELELVEAGCHFRCAIDLAEGKATLRATPFEFEEPIESFAPTADVNVAGNVQLRFANVDDTLLLWVNDRLVTFDGSTKYDVVELFGSREEMIPQTSDQDAGDLAPASIGISGTEVTVDRLQIHRDIYYIADSSRRSRQGAISDLDFERYRNGVEGVETERGFVPLAELAASPEAWDVYADRRSEEFSMEEGQLFVMGDNSPASLDCRLWASGNGRDQGHPGGPYLEESLLIGKAVFVYWPHSWGPLPNLSDMRLVR